MVRQSIRRRTALLATFIFLLVLTLAGAAAALRLQTGSTVLKFDAHISPRKLSRTAATPATVRVSGLIFATDGSVPPNLRKVVVKVNGDVAFGTVGLPKCRVARIESVTTAVAARRCRRALFGRGTMGVEVAFPEAAPTDLRGKILVFNGGIRHGVSELLIHSFLPEPIPTSIVTKAQIRPAGKGHGALATAIVPKIAGGIGSVTSFNVRIAKKYSFRGIARSVVSANCTHGRIRVGVRGIFGNGASVHGSVTHGCKAR